MKLFIIYMILSTSILAQIELTQNTLQADSGFSHDKTSLTQFSLLSGEWIGEAFGGIVEEYWTEPFGNSVVGLFKLTSSDSTVFTEFFQLALHDENYQLRLKHFWYDLIGWEEKEEFVTFQFIKKENNRLYFNGLTYERNDDNNMTVYLAMHNKEKKSVNEIVIKLKRKGMELNEELLNADKAFAKLSLESGAAEAFRVYLSEDAKQFPNKRDIISGNQNIYEAMKPNNDSHTLEWFPQEAEVSSSGDFGYSWGFYKSYSKSNPSLINEGKYVNVWKKINGEWKVIIDIGNPS